MNFEEREIIVQGTKIVLENGKGSDIYVSKNLSDDMDKVSSQIAWWSSVKAAALAEQEMVDAGYRQWRAQKAMELLGDGDKIPEWKVKNEIDADAKFIGFKQAIAKAAENVAAADGMLQAFLKKSNILQSLGASLRAERDTVEVATKTRREPAPVLEDDDEDDLGPEPPAKDEEPPPRKKVGRPKGSGAKKESAKDPEKAKAYYEEEAKAAAASESASEEPPKRKRGRPPKPRPEGEEEAPKRPRGRPRKVRPDGEPEPVKRPRGRPKKVQPEAETTGNKTVAEVDLDDDDFPASYGSGGESAEKEESPAKELDALKARRERMKAAIKAKKK